MINAIQRILNDTVYIICHTDFSSERGQKLIKTVEKMKLPEEVIYPTLGSAYHDFNGDRSALKGFQAILKRASIDDLKTRLPAIDQLNAGQLEELQSRDITTEPVPTVVFIDLFFHTPQEFPQAVAETLKMFPASVFVLYANKDDYNRQRTEFPAEWAERLQHYYKLFDVEGAVFEQSVQQALNMARPLAVAKRKERATKKTSIFISYSRTDKEFADDLVNRLRGDGYDVWIDKQELVGGSDWMDSIQQALDKSQQLILIISPESLESRYVKIEYRYFINDKKALIPVLVKPVQKLPPELSLYQFVDFTVPDFELAYSQNLLMR